MYPINITRLTFSTLVGMVGSTVVFLFGGWTPNVLTLLICMIVDFFTGLAVATIFQKSKKTENGAYESRVGYKGMCRKCTVFLFVIIAYQVDKMLGTDYLKNTICIGFSINEILSIVENMGLMGIPLPKSVTKMLEILKNKEDLK